MYCTINDLQQAYGIDRVTAWSRMDGMVLDRAIRDAAAEIDSYLLSGGYPVPLPGPPDAIRKYCIDIAAANLIVGIGVIKDDAGGQAVLDQARVARRFLEKVASGTFKVPGFAPAAGDQARLPAGTVRVVAPAKLDWRGY